MNKETYRRAFALFDEICDLPAAARNKLIDDRCAGDAELRTAIEQMLLQDAKDDENLSPGAGAELIASQVMEMPGNLIPERIGRFKVIREIGHGGMGVVYAAEQDEPKRLVALKVIKAATLSKERIRRFKNEAFVLGQLQHPGIATIYESGVAMVNGLSQPFFAMELVRGDPILAFAQSRGLTVRQKLDLIARVCDAVQHAHQKGIIHRDIKPANILVVEQTTESTHLDSEHSTKVIDAIGQPKILDFGIARATDQDGQAITMQTDIGQLVGTLPYMSPEQIEGDRRHLDTRSDIYGLGVVMYQLLSNTLPLDVSGKSVAEAARLIRDREPSKLSSVVSQARGDIDTIVQKALEKSPERRYQTAAELAADIRRFLADQPITARPASVGYLVRKFARRNRVMVGGVAATFAALIIGLVGTSYFLSEALRQRDAAESERARTATVAEFQAKLLDGISPRRFGRNLKRDLRVEYRHVLEDSTNDNAEIENELASFEAALRQINGTNLARSVLSGELAERAIVQIEGGLTEDPVTEASLRYAVGRMYMQLGMYAEALDQFLQVMAQRQEHLGVDDPETHLVMNHVGLMYREMGRVSEAEKVFREALALRRSVHGDDHKHTLTSLYNLGALMRYKGDLQSAEPLLKDVVERTEKLLGTDHARSLSRRNTHCVVLLDLGKIEEALQCIRQVYEATERVSGPDQRRTIVARNNLMATLFKANRIEEAEPIARDVLASSRRRDGDDHPSTSLARNNLGMVLLQLDRLEEAEALFRLAHETCRINLNPEQELSMKSTSNLIDALLGLDRAGEAELLCRSLVATRRQLNPPQLGLVAQTLEQLGISLFQQERFQESVEAWQECVDLRTNISADHWLTHRARSRLGEAFTELRDFQQAEPLLLSSQAALESQSATIPQVAGAGCIEEAGARIFRLYQRWGKLEQAEQWRRLQE